MRDILTRFALPLLLVLPSGCGVGFDPGSEVGTLRVLGVRKDKPYPGPGETVNLSVLWHDGLADPSDPESGREAEVVWLPPCFNPPGDQYSACLLQFTQQFVQEPGLFERLSRGETSSFQVPLEIVPLMSLPGVPRYGLTYAFFSVCAGTVGLEPPGQEGALPLVCRNAEGERLGPDAFVFGYVGLFTFGEVGESGERFGNQNPIVEGFEVEGSGFESCLNEECLTASPEDGIDCDVSPERCFPACEKDGEPECPKIELRPLVSASSAEQDDVSQSYYGRNVGEQMWINYYTDRGSVRGDGVRLLNDATKGWNEDYGIEFYAPKAPGPVTLWAVVHDNRGGTAWTRTQIQIE